jgi:hypothetical protein
MDLDAGDLDDPVGTGVGARRFGVEHDQRTIEREKTLQHAGHPN